MTDRPTQPELLREASAIDKSGPVTCLGMTFANEDERRAYFTARLREYLQDPAFRAIEGFPIGADEDILDLSDPPYYTACPNPFLPQIMTEWQAERAALHANLGINDESYHREPFATDVSEGKNDPIYNAHSYHTKVPHKAIMRYILHYTEPGDIVFDGFCGTGMTGVAAQLCGDRKTVESLGYQVAADDTIYDNGKVLARLGTRKAVLNDLSPAATFIAYNYNTPVDVTAFEREAKRILQEVENECGWMYETWHPHCDDPNRVKARVNYIVWSDVFVCTECTGEFTFWDVAVNRDTGVVEDIFFCPHCSTKHTKASVKRAIETVYSAKLSRVIDQSKQRPVVVNYTVDRKRLDKIPDNFDLNLVDTVARKQIDTFYPDNRIDIDIDMWYERDYRSLGVYTIDSFFTHRNLYVLSKIWNAMKISPKFNRLAFVFTGTVQIASRMSSFRFDSRNPQNTAGGILKGALYIPSLSKEAHVSDLLLRRLNFIIKMLEQIKSFQSRSSLLSTQSSHFNYLHPNSLDYIFTDPPFGSNIISRLLQLKKSIPKQRKGVKTAVNIRIRTIHSQLLSNRRAGNITKPRTTS